MTHLLRMSKTIRVFASAVLLAAPSLVGAQKPIPIRQLGPVEARSKDTVGYLRGVRELSDGHVLANDADNRRLLLFDATFAAFKVVADTTAGTPRAYGARTTTIM